MDPPEWVVFALKHCCHCCWRWLEVLSVWRGNLQPNLRAWAASGFHQTRDCWFWASFRCFQVSFLSCEVDVGEVLQWLLTFWKLLSTAHRNFGVNQSDNWVLGFISWQEPVLLFLGVSSGKYPGCSKHLLFWMREALVLPRTFSTEFYFLLSSLVLCLDASFHLT